MDRKRITSRLIFFLLTILFLNSCTGERRDDKSVLKYNTEDGIGSLDPAFASNLPNMQAVAQLFNGLLELDSNLNVKPCLAESWEVSEDKMEYTFKIRKDVFFHDHELFAENTGKQVTAYDFEYSLKRICDTTDLFNQGIWIFKDIVLRGELGQISDTCFKAINDSVFKVYLERPAPQLLQILTMAYTSVVPQEVAKKLGLDFRKSPVGTGAFRFGEWVEGEALVLYKNEKYWKRDEEGRRLPYLDAVEISFMPDKGQVFRSFLLGGIDFIRNVEESSLDEILYRDGGFKESFTEKYKLEKTPYFNTEYLGIQLDSSAEIYKKRDRKSPLLNKDFRLALSYSVDRKKIISYLKNGIGFPGENGLIPPPMPDVEGVKGQYYDVDKARYHLVKSGIDLMEVDPIQITVAQIHQPLLEFIVTTWWEVLGVKVELDIKEAKTARVLVNSGKSAFFKQDWLGDYPEAGNYMSLLYSGNVPPFGPNRMNFKNKVCDSLYLKAQITLDDQKRADLYTQMDGLAMAEVPMIILFYDELLQLSQKNIKGLQANAMNLLILETVSKE